MKKIRITESQLKKIQEAEKYKGKSIKITESQLKRIQESLKSGPLEANIDKNFKREDIQEGMGVNVIDLIDFGKMVMQAINFFFTDSSQKGLSPIWVELGMSQGDVRRLLLTSGLVYSVAGIGGEKTYKIIKKGFIKILKRLYNTIIERRYDMKNKGEVIKNSEMDENSNLPPGAENDPNAPWKQEDSEQREMAKFNDFQVLKNFGDFVILVDDKGNKFYVDLINFDYGLANANDDELKNEINLAFENGKLNLDKDGTNLFGMDVISLITPENKEELLDNIEDPELEMLINDMNETTTTGSVGGSYETNAIWAKDPNNSRYSKTPMIKGGKILKKRGKISEVEKAGSERYVVEMDMYLSGADERDVKIQAIEIEDFINKRYDGKARVTKMAKMDFGASSIGENNELEGDNLIN